jgi:hypothetical protein
MSVKKAYVEIEPQRQPNQYSCTATSLSMALQALGIPKFESSVQQVNAVLGAVPLHGASWDQVAGAASHFGCRATLIVPATLEIVKNWTDAKKPVLIGWNTGNDWSHASLIFDVTDTQVYIADPNLPNPSENIKILKHNDFYDKWWEKSNEGYKIRRPAMAIEREITPEGKQVVANMSKESGKTKPTTPPKKDPNKIEIKAPGKRNEVQQQVIKDRAKGTGGAGAHRNREDDLASGRSRKEKHKKDWKDKEAAENVASRYFTASYTGNPGEDSIYPNEIDHGYAEPLAGGTDVMRRLQNQLLKEQGNDQRPSSPQIPKKAFDKEGYEACIKYLDDNMVKFPKGTGWWLPAHNFAINLTMLGELNVWVFDPLPFAPTKRSFIPEGEDSYLYPAGLVLGLKWVSHPDYVNERFPATVEIAEHFVGLAKKHKTVGETMKEDLKWIGIHFGFPPPSNITEPYILNAAKIAARRWGINRMKTPDTFVPLDGRKAVPMPSWGRPRIK